MSRRQPVLLLLVATLLWSSAGVSIKLISWNVLAIASVRGAIAAAVLLLFARDLFSKWSFYELGGALAYAASQLLFVSATRFTTAANAVFLQYTAPIYVALFGCWFLRERTRRLDWVVTGAVLVGMSLFFRDQLTPRGYLGNVLGVSSGITFAWMILFLRKLKHTLTLEAVFLGNVITALAGMPFVFQSSPSTSSWIGLILMGVFQLGLSYVIYAQIIRYLRAMEAVLIQSLEPILNPVWVCLVIGEIPGPWALVGAAMVFISVSFRAVVAAREKEEEMSDGLAPRGPEPRPAVSLGKVATNHMSRGKRRSG